MNALQTEFELSRAGDSQNTRILKHLKAQRGLWVAMPHLVESSGGYAVHSRISDLRKMGFQIEHKNEIQDGKTHSFYKLI